MEDQQPGSGDLTTEATSAAEQPRRRLFRRRSKNTPPTVQPDADVAESSEATTPTEITPKTPMGKSARAARTKVGEQDSDPTTDAEAVENSGVAVADAGEPEPDESVETEETAEPDPVTLVAHRPAGRGLIMVAVAASVAFVGASAFAGAAVKPYLSERALVETKLNIARTATDAIRTLWTYTPEDMSTLADRASAYLGGDFADEYRRYIDAIVEPNKQAQVTNNTEVIGVAVESVAPPSIPTEATALVYTNSVATSPVTKNIPALRYLSYRLTMVRDGGEWRITRMSTITSFDLTPQL